MSVGRAADHNVRFQFHWHLIGRAADSHLPCLCRRRVAHAGYRSQRVAGRTLLRDQLCVARGLLPDGRRQEGVDVAVRQALALPRDVAPPARGRSGRPPSESRQAGGGRGGNVPHNHRIFSWISARIFNNHVFRRISARIPCASGRMKPQQNVNQQRTWRCPSCLEFG